MSTLTHKLLQHVGMFLPLRLIYHEGRPYLRRYYVGTFLGIRCYLHHFVDSDPDGLHNHPWRFGASIILSGSYQEERRFCKAPNQRWIRWFNLVNGDTLHRVLICKDGAGNPMTVWSLFFHTKKLMPWATVKDKGVYKQYFEEQPEHTQIDGHSSWYVNAPKGRDLLHPDGTEKNIYECLRTYIKLPQDL